MVSAALSRIHQISMRAHDVERAVRFYRDTLGLRFLFAAAGILRLQRRTADALDTGTRI